MSDWVVLLDEMERLVAQANDVLDGAGPAPAFPVWSDNPGDLPLELRARAERLYALTVDAEVRAELAMSMAAEASSRARAEAPPPAPAYVDRRI